MCSLLIIYSSIGLTGFTKLSGYDWQLVQFLGWSIYLLWQGVCNTFFLKKSKNYSRGSNKCNSWNKLCWHVMTCIMETYRKQIQGNKCTENFLPLRRRKAVLVCICVYILVCISESESRGIAKENSHFTLSASTMFESYTYRKSSLTLPTGFWKLALREIMYNKTILSFHHYDKITWRKWSYLRTCCKLFCLKS